MKNIVATSDQVWSEVLAYQNAYLVFGASEDGLELLSFGFSSEQEARDWLVAQGSVTQAEQAPSWISRLQFTSRLVKFLEQGSADDFQDIPLNWKLVSSFQKVVYQRLRQLGRGDLLSYRDLAAAIGKPLGARAVGSAMARNPWPLIVPCHRVVPSGRGLGGFSAAGGVTTKLRLLEQEGHTHFSATR